MTIGEIKLWGVVVGVLTFSFLFWWLSRRRPAGFKEWLKNPELFNQLCADPEAIQLGIARAREWPDADLRKELHRYVWKGSDLPGTPEKHVLLALGERVRPWVLELLGDPALQARLTSLSKNKLFKQSPLERACGLLSGPAAAAAIPRLIPFQSHPNEEIRKIAALALGSIGTPEAVAPVRTALRDEEPYVRSYALIGLNRAVAAGELHAACLPALFEDLKKLITAGNNVGAAADLLLLADSAAATDFLRRSEALQPDAPALEEVLACLAKKQIGVPRGPLLTLIEALERREMKHPLPYALGSALHLLGQQRERDDREFLHARTTHPEKRIAEGAAEGLVAWVGLAGFSQRLWKTLAEGKLADLPVPQQRYLAVVMLDAEVNNGGFSQYFFNSAGDHWRDAQVGLDMMGFQERAEMLRDATNRFGPAGPSADRTERQEQLARLARKNENEFDDLDDRYYQCQESVEVLSCDYVVKHHELFQPIGPVDP